MLKQNMTFSKSTSKVTNVSTKVLCAPSVYLVFCTFNYKINI